MENREVPKLWDRSAEQSGPLRRPNANPAQDDAQSNAADFSILSKTSLRVDAEEWFPPSYAPTVTAPNVHSVQNRLQRVRIGQQDNNVPPEGSLVANHQRMTADTSRLQEIVKSLTYDPGQFDNVVETFMAVLNPYLEDIHVVSNAADMIFEQALHEPSFRYNAARLCSVIDEHCPLFRSKLHTLCERQLELGGCEQGLTLFLAELYMQSHYENIYGRSLLASIKNLISLQRPEDIKCICQTLKLAGCSLELYNTKTLEAIFRELNTIRSSMPPSLNGLLDSVFELRQNQWGHAAPMAPNNSYPQEPNGFTSSLSKEEFRLYGPDGQEITIEEQEFLRANFEDPNDYLGDEPSDPDDLFDPEPEMDEEIQAAFREFVKMSRR